MRGKSLDLLEVEIEANEIEKSISAYDFKPNQYVHIRTDEGYIANIPSAFVLQYKGWYIIFAEHHDPLTFHFNDIESIFEYQITRHHNKIPETKNFKPIKRKGKK